MKEVTIDLDAQYDKIPILARRLLDVPFVLYGRDPNVGIDCVAVVALAASQAGFDCSNMLVRTLDDHGNRTPLMDAVMADTSAIKKIKQVRPGDVLWFRLDFMPCEMHHFAIVTETNPIKFLEASLLQTTRPGEKALTDPIISEFRTLGGYDRWLRGVFRFRRLNEPLEL